ncbi:flagellar motor protein MotA [Pelagibius litoralis]|uniref:Flagellar motor protein MotA n=1 Tax=Pelagibius litoralis TaxID=374515 RepID=A0A967EXZ8_9PROT|nr:flagellar motor protein MotA [Pelagibius litoralis]
MASTETSGSREQIAAAPKAPRLSPTVDFATLLGISGAFAMIAGAMVLGGQPSAFLDIPAVLIVIGGTFLVTTVSFSLGEVGHAQGLMFRAAVYHAETQENAVLQALYLADLARKRGRLALQNVTDELADAPFLHHAISLVVDGLPAEEVERILAQDTQATYERHLRSAGILRRAGEVAPAMGLIGTLVGLVQMLGNLDDPSTIGPAMAVALLTTFYGAVLANMVFTPLATKLERNAQIESVVRQIYTIGAASISRQENPRRLEMLLNTVLAPSQRVDYFS